MCESSDTKTNIQEDWGANPGRNTFPSHAVINHRPLPQSAQGHQSSTCLDFGLGTRGFITGDFSFAARLRGMGFLDDLFILSKILVERVEFTDTAGSLELTST